MSQVAPPESGEDSKPDPATTFQPQTPPINPINSSEPVSPTEIPSSDNPSTTPTTPTTTQTSTVTESPSIPKAESRVAESSLSDIPGPTPSLSPSAAFNKPAAPVATLVPNTTTDSKPNNLNPNVFDHGTPNSVTNNTQQTTNNHADTQPIKGESLVQTEHPSSDPSKSEATTVETHPESFSSHLQTVSDSQNLNTDTQQQSAEPPKSAPKNPPPAPRLNPRRLPKAAKNRPNNARVFIGNLASEYTSADDIVSIFEKFGTLIEEPVLRRSFGFVQYSTAEAATKAVEAEQGRIIGGIGIDLSIADNREVKKGTHVQNNTPFQHTKSQHGYQSMRGRVRERENADAMPEPRKKRRSVSPTSAARKGGVHPPQYRRYRPEPKNGVYLRILCMSPTAKGYAKHCENTFRSMTGLKADILHILAAGLGEALGRAMRDSIPYVMVVASKDVEDGTCTIRTLEKTGYEKSGRGNGVIPLREAVEVCLIERGVIAPSNMAQQMGPTSSMSRHPTALGGMPSSSRPPQGGSQWLGQSHQMPNQLEKPGWMTGPRPPHPANQGGHRPPAHPPSFPPGGPPNFGYNDARQNYGHSGLQRSGPPQFAPPHMQGRPDGYGRGSGPHPYEASSGDVRGPSANHDYGRGGHTQPYQSQINPIGSYEEKYGQDMSRGGNYGPQSGRETEYDPVSVNTSQRAAQAGGYPSWNRVQGPGIADSYTNNVQGMHTQPPSNFMPASQPFPTQTHGGSNNQGYSNRQEQMYGGGNQAAHFRDQQAHNHNGRGVQGGYDSYDGGVPYRRDVHRQMNNNMSQQNQRYSNEAYDGSNGAYQSGGYQAGGYQPRDNRSGWDQQQASSMGPASAVAGMANAPPPGYGSEPVRQPQPQNHGYGEDFRNAQNPYDGRRPNDPPQAQYNVGNSAGDMRDPRGNQRYNADHGSSVLPNQPYHSQTTSGSNMQSHVSAHTPVSGAGTVDIDKLTNLISAFQQKQQQNSQQQARSQQPQQHQPRRHLQPPQGQPHHGAGHDGHNMQGDRQGATQFLQMPGAHQALQNIGGSGVRGYQGGYQQGMNVQNSGVNGSMVQSRGRGPHQGVPPTQNYYS